MKLLRIAAIILLVLSFVGLYFFHIEEVGSSAKWSNAESHFSAGSHPIVLCWTLLAIAFYFVLMRANVDATSEGIPSLKRRFAAFWIDFWYSALALSSIGGLIPLWLEAVRTGSFAWHFERDYSVDTDAIYAFPLVLVTMGLMFLYFVFPLTKGKQTIGCFIMGIRVTPPFGDEGRFTFREAVRRTWYEFRGLCWWPGANRGRDSYGRTWWDRETNCSVVKVDYK